VRGAIVGNENRERTTPSYGGTKPLRFVAGHKTTPSGYGGGMSLKITFVCPSDNPSGGMRVIALYARKLAERGHQITVAIPRSSGPTLRQRLSALVRKGTILRDKPNPISFFKETPFDVSWLQRRDRVLNSDVPDADVVIATWWESLEWVWAFDDRKGRKLHFMQDYEIWGHPDFTDIPRIDRAYALPIPKIVIAEWERRLLQTKWQVSALDVIRNSVDLNVFFADVRDKQSIPTVGFTYSTIFDKGCSVVLEALELARKTIPDLRVVSFGATRPSEQFPEYVEFHHAVPDEKLRLIYESCDAWLFGTRREGFGLPILEAMACRTPVIGTPAGAGQDLIGAGGGILVPIDDPASMADAIAKVAKMPSDKWRAISKVAHDTATQYSWDDAADKFEKVVLTLATQP
jgi:glycosyltransferase involved in cell wall biosynthesis